MAIYYLSSFIATFVAGGIVIDNGDGSYTTNTNIALVPSAFGATTADSLIIDVDLKVNGGHIVETNDGTGTDYFVSIDLAANKSLTLLSSTSYVYIIGTDFNMYGQTILNDGNLYVGEDSWSNSIATNMNIKSGGILTGSSGSYIYLRTTGSICTVESGGIINLHASNLDTASGTTLTIDVGGLINIYHGTTIAIQGTLNGSLNYVCFLKGSNILTSNGYKKIENITNNDLVQLSSGKLGKIKEIIKFKLKSKSNFTPYIIPKGKYNAIEDLYLSKNHCLKVKNFFIPICQLKGIKKTNYEDFEYLEYYNLITENFFSDSIIANGIACETLTYINELNKEDIRKFKELRVHKNGFRRIEGTNDSLKTVLNYVNVQTRKELSKKDKSKSK